MNDDDLKKASASIRRTKRDPVSLGTGGVDPDALRIAKEELARRTLEARQNAKKSWAPHLDPDNVPPGYAPKGASVLTDAEGNVRLVWRKTTKDVDPFELAQQVAAGLESGGLTALPEIPAPKDEDDDLLCVYPLGDPHIGLYTWAAECGESFDLEIAEKQYLAAAACLLPRAPKGTDALVIDLGDFFHADDPQYRTSSGRNTVDVDTRYERVVMTGIRIQRTLIDAMLAQHRKVYFWALRGNHDDRSTLTLREALRGIYANNPRVIVDATPGKFHYYEFGANLLAATHGDGIKGKRGRTLTDVMITDQRRAFGRTDHAKWYVGHVHHSSVEEIGPILVETFRTLAPKDAWHTATGYRSGRDTRLDIWHREFGFRGSKVADIAEIQQWMKENQ